MGGVPTYDFDQTAGTLLLEQRKDSLFLDQLVFDVECQDQGVDRMRISALRQQVKGFGN